MLEATERGSFFTMNDDQQMLTGRVLPATVLFGVSGACGACTSGVLLYPLDTVRTRLQLQCGTTMKRYKGVISAFRLMLREESVRAFYRGLPIHITALSSWAFLYFGTYNALKRSLPSNAEHPMQQAVAAGSSWILSALLTNPLWIIKTRAQAQKEPFSLYRAAQEWEHLRRRGHLMVGVQAAMWGAVTVMIQLPFYEYLKATFLSKGLFLDSRDSSHLSPWGYFVCSTVSMATSSTLTYPQDVIRARLQGTNHYKGAIHCIRTTVMEESLRGLYSGLGAHLVRLLPTGAITFIVYEWTCRWLANHVGTS